MHFLTALHHNFLKCHFDPVWHKHFTHFWLLLGRIVLYPENRCTSKNLELLTRDTLPSNIVIVLMPQYRPHEKIVFPMTGYLIWGMPSSRCSWLLPLAFLSLKCPPVLLLLAIFHATRWPILYQSNHPQPNKAALSWMVKSAVALALDQIIRIQPQYNLRFPIKNRLAHKRITSILCRAQLWREILLAFCFLPFVGTSHYDLGQFHKSE